ncbi:helicase, partial [Tanacetum coccineum]
MGRWAMALCRAYDNPDLFITFTSNPKWPEIAEMLNYFPGQKAHDRPEVGTRVFKIKLTELLDDLTKKHVFGESRAVVYVIEFQKRGLPHAHILLWLEEQWKCKTPSEIDDKISAELPSPIDDPDSYKVVLEIWCLSYGNGGKSVVDRGGEWSQDKYVAEILKKFGFKDVKSASTLIEKDKPFLNDVDITKSHPKESHHHAVKENLRYLKAQPKLGLLYLNRFTFDLSHKLISDYAGATLDRKSTTRDLLTKAFDIVPTSGSGLPYKYLYKFGIPKALHISQDIKPTGSEDFAEIVDFLNASHISNGEQEIHAKVDGKTKVITEASVRGHLKLADANDEVAFTSVDVRHGGATNTVSSLDARQGSGNIDKTPFISHASLPRGNTIEGDEDSMKLTLQELMETCTLLKRKVLGLEKKTTNQAEEILSLKETITGQATEIIGLKERVKKLKEDAFKQGRRIEDIDQDEDITLISPIHVSDQDNVIKKDLAGVFSVAHILTDAQVSTNGQPVTTAGKVFTTASVNLTTAAIKVTTAGTTITASTRQKGVVIHEPVSQRVTITIPQLQSQEKAK